jgi:hypothetical protein
MSELHSMDGGSGRLLRDLCLPYMSLKILKNCPLLGTIIQSKSSLNHCQYVSPRKSRASGMDRSVSLLCSEVDADELYVDWCLDGHRRSLRNSIGGRRCYARSRLQNRGTERLKPVNPNIGSIADSYQAKLSALQEKLQASNTGSKIIYKVADVGDYDTVDAAVASAVEELGRIDILINNVRHALCH